jgi:GNAT superfamily N-acetyltransferase
MTEENGPPSEGPVSLTFTEVGPRENSEVLQHFYDEILRPSFTPEELVDPWWGPEVGPEEETSWTVVATGNDGTIYGGIVGDFFNGSKVLLISYVAVRKSARGMDVGTRLLRWTSENWYHRHGCRLVVGELDDPRHWPSEQQDPVARLRFYDRFRIKALSTPYYQPSVGANRPPVFNMLLASFDPGADAVISGNAVEGPIVKQFLEEYLAGSSIANGGDGSIDGNGAWLLSHYDGGDIPLVPLLEYETIPDLRPPH